MTTGNKSVEELRVEEMAEKEFPKPLPNATANAYNYYSLGRAAFIKGAKSQSSRIKELEEALGKIKNKCAESEDPETFYSIASQALNQPTNQNK